MKRAILTGCSVLCALVTALSQDSLPVIKLKAEPRFYVNLHTGYSMALGSTFKFYPDDISSVAVTKVDNHAPVTQTSYSAAGKGLGEGVRVGAGLSYILNDFINVGLDVDYFRSTISKARDSSFQQTFTTGTVASDTYRERYTISYDAILLTFTPSITFKAISRPKWFIYNKIGAVITIRPNSIEHDVDDVSTNMKWQNGFSKDSSSHSDMKLDWGIKNPSLGFMGAIGGQVKLSEKIRVFAELQFSHVVFVVRKRTITSYTVNGAEMVNTLPASEREIDFQKNYSTSSAANPNQPGSAVTQRLPITYVGLQTGIAFRF